MSDVGTDTAKSTSTKSEDRVLEIERHIKATPEKVFDAWTKPEQLVKWWGPEGFNVPEHVISVVKGGGWRTVMRSPEGTLHTCAGVYRTIDRPNRLEFTWAWEQEDGKPGHETLVAVTFEPADGGTRMRLVQKTFESATARDGHRGGWTSSFDCLERLFA